MRGLFIAGTDTGVGKTHVATALARTLAARGLNVVPRKPAESGCEERNGQLFPADAAALREASGWSGPLQQVCPYRLRAPLAPPRAAQLQGERLSLRDLQAACADETDGFLLVEGAGGLYSPLAEDALNIDLAQALNLPVLLVCEDRLGTLSPTLLAVEALYRRGLTLAAVVLNRITPQPDTLDNRSDLAEWLPRLGPAPPLLHNLEIAAWAISIHKGIEK
ncbi:MAG: dethiobiotin synthase [Halothiobacillaceae bacterium]|nr:dethiobiotin synthase [Halothiobacillaceae bacterium]